MAFHGGDIYNYREGILDFSSNINPLGVPDSFRRLLAERLEEFTRYPDVDYREVRSKIAAYLGIGNADCIVPGNGAVELIYKLVAASGSRRVVGLRPTFSEYARAAKAAGLEYADMEPDSLLLGVKPNDLVIICNPNNPTGKLIKKAEMKELAAALSNMGCRLVIDEAFMEFTDSYPKDSMIDCLDQFESLTIIKAATKFFGMPGIRLGYGITASPAAAKAVKAYMEPWNLNTAAVIAAGCIFEDKDYIEKSRVWIRSERSFLYEKLTQFKELKVWASYANFHLLELTGGRLDAKQLKSDMVRNGVLIRTADGFNGLSDCHFRLAVKDRKSNELLLKALKKSIE
jgi:threonine-phosphate decarboxylase